LNNLKIMMVASTITAIVFIATTVYFEVRRSRVKELEGKE